MRLLLLYLAGCRAGDHDLFLDRAYWARRLPLTLTENGSANEFGRCGRGNGFNACKCYAPSLDTVEALATASLAWTLDAPQSTLYLFTSFIDHALRANTTMLLAGGCVQAAMFSVANSLVSRPS